MTDKQYYEYKRIKYELILKELRTTANEENIGQTAINKHLTNQFKYDIINM